MRQTERGTYFHVDLFEKGQVIRCILLDTRSQKSEEEGTILGKEQWKWFEEVLDIPLGRVGPTSTVAGGSAGAEETKDEEKEEAVYSQIPDMFTRSESSTVKPDKPDWYLIATGTTMLVDHSKFFRKAGFESWEDDDRAVLLDALEERNIGNRCIGAYFSVYFCLLRTSTPLSIPYVRAVSLKKTFSPLPICSFINMKGERKQKESMKRAF